MKFTSLIKTLAAVIPTSILMGCGATTILSTPVENIDTIPLKISELSEAEKQHWMHADLFADTIPGMSVDRAYDEIIKNKKGQTVIVAVLDSGIDLEHEDLDGVLWTNTDERPGNGVDDDNNGYVDDIHGYNFLGESYNEQLEFARMLRLGIGDASTQAKAKQELEKEYNEALQFKQQYEQAKQMVSNAHEAVKQKLGKDNYTKEEVVAIEAQTETMQQHKSVLLHFFQFTDNISDFVGELQEGVDHFTEQLNYNLNLEFDGRSVVGDDPYNFNDRNYGNGNPDSRSEDESHGTHVAGIIAAERNNGKGIKGVANNVKIMSIRAVPNGDEYDKDIALGIRYAVDNGAKIINCSFGKSFSPNAAWVWEAIKYAASKDVLIVHAAGNDGNDIDLASNPNYPNDHQYSGTEISDNWIEVGALAPTYGSKMVAVFSNYGNKNVDVFAPGGEIYSTMPDNDYEFQGGTSMAAPAVSGIAALIRSHHPSLTAAQVKQVLLQSGLKSKANVILGGDAAKSRSFSEVSKSGKMVNAYNALLLAEQLEKGKTSLGLNAE